MRFAGFCIALSLLCAGAAAAQAPALPIDRLSTHVMAIAPPAQWKTYFAIDRFLVEQGTLSPQDQSQLYWRDQIGYVAVPNSVGSVNAISFADQTERTCARSQRTTFPAPPRFAQPGDDWVALICLVGINAPDAIPQAPLEIIVINSRVTVDAMFLYWRAWRGTLAEAPAMFALHRGRAPVLPANPSSADFGAWSSAMERLIQDFAAQIDHTLTICDLAGRPCPSLHVAAPRTPANAIALIAEQGSGADAPADHDTPADTADFASAETASGVASAMLAARTGGGGIISLSGASADPERAARLRAYLLRVGRESAATRGIDADALTFDLWPGAH